MLEGKLRFVHDCGVQHHWLYLLACSINVRIHGVQSWLRKKQEATVHQLTITMITRPISFLHSKRLFLLRAKSKGFTIPCLAECSHQHDTIRDTRVDRVQLGTRRDCSWEEMAKKCFHDLEDTCFQQLQSDTRLRLAVNFIMMLGVQANVDVTPSKKVKRFPPQRER